jgi:ParB family transcriptional regulator, chromosome partitioning protein
MSVKKSGLGRGLDALLGSAPVDVVTEKDKLKSLPIEYLKSGRYQPRKDFDPVRLQELADSIVAQGIMQPILVRRIDANRYEILAGERRWRAAQLAGLHEVPSIIREVSDQAALAIALIENLQREDLNPLEEAEALRRLHQEFSLTHQQIADSVAKSRTTVTNLLRLNDLHADVKTLVRNSDIEMGHARAILGLPDAQQIEVAQKIVARGLNVRETEALVRHILEGKQAVEPVKKDPDVASLEKNLSQTLGVRVEIRHNKKGVGKLVISYDSLDQLEGVVGRFSE